jgi:ATP-dependent DNA helicase RecG
MDIKVSQLVGGMKAKYKREVLESISSGETKIIVGTHAMFESEINYCRLGYIIIDEQHRFGVAQRAELKRLASDSFVGGGISPHILVMTATPIPRTLSMTLYGDLDVSIIREMPKNRKPIITKVTFESQMSVVYDFIKKQLDSGRQAYIVYPLVEKSEKLELKAATEHFESLRANVFEKYTCGLLHGQMFWYEKDDAMKDFLSLKYQVLVATTVIEVGIDVPNATVMLIENAERFGLSQLHQLRGRVGRGSEQSYCILSTKEHFKYHIRKEALFGEERKAAIIRLKTMEETCDGFKIAETDLMLRGPGDMLGTRQTGLPDFKYTDLTADGDIISLARNEARSILDKDITLSTDENSIIRTTLGRIQSSHGNFFGIA